MIYERTVKATVRITTVFTQVEKHVNLDGTMEKRILDLLQSKLIAKDIEVLRIEQTVEKKSVDDCKRRSCRYFCNKSINGNGCKVLTSACDPDTCWRFETEKTYRERTEKCYIKANSNGVGVGKLTVR